MELGMSCDTAYPQMAKCHMILLMGQGWRESLKGINALWRGTLTLELGRRYLMPLNCLSKVVNYTWCDFRLSYLKGKSMAYYVHRKNCTLAIHGTVMNVEVSLFGCVVPFECFSCLPITWPWWHWREQKEDIAGGHGGIDSAHPGVQIQPSLFIFLSLPFPAPSLSSTGDWT